MTFFFSDANFPFAVALVLMLIIALLEGVLVIIGLGLSAVLDSLLPDLDIELPSSGVGKFLVWLGIGQVPSIVILVEFLLFFGICGIMLQFLTSSLFAITLPVLLASIVALVIAFPLTRYFTKTLEGLFFKDETAALSPDDFIGQVVTITLGQARKNHPAEARFNDQFGTTHYLMVEPDDDNDVFLQGDRVMLTQQRGAVYHAISSKIR